MKWFNRSNDDYPLSAEEDAKSAAAGVSWLLYAVLIAAVLITAAHAVLLVINTTASYTSDDGGLFGAILHTIRVLFPVIVEIAAVAVGLGFIRSKWRVGQLRRGRGRARAVGGHPTSSASAASRQLRSVISR